MQRQTLVSSLQLKQMLIPLHTLQYLSKAMSKAFHVGGLRTNRRPARSPSRRPLCVNMNDVERVRELVCHFQAPLRAGPQPTVHALDHLARGHSCLLPGRMHVRKLLTFEVELGSIVIDVEKVSRHDETRSGGVEHSRNAFVAVAVPGALEIIRLQVAVRSRQHNKLRYWTGVPSAAFALTLWMD